MSFADLTDDVLVACMATFGETVSYTPQATGIPVSVTGIFDSEHEEIELRPETGIPVSTRRPRLGIRLADLALAPKAGDTATIGGAGYSVVDVQPDGWGGATLRLLKT